LIISSNKARTVSASLGMQAKGTRCSGAERIELMRRISKRVNGPRTLGGFQRPHGNRRSSRVEQGTRRTRSGLPDGAPPYFLKTDGDGLMYYFDAISKAVKIPIMVQDAPLMTQVAMPPALLARMGREIENVKYVKVEAPPTRH